MTKTLQPLPSVEALRDSATKPRSEAVRRIRELCNKAGVDFQASTLVIGCSADDLGMLGRIGFTKLTASNLTGELAEQKNATRPLGCLPLDAESIKLPDNSFEYVFAYAVLHHCRLPPLALAEMLRVSRRGVIFGEPHDSASIRLLVALGLSDPFELSAVAGNEGLRGGVRFTAVPNYIFRWNRSSVIAMTSSNRPEYQDEIESTAYWDFELSASDMEGRSYNRVGGVCRLVGVTRFLSALRRLQRVLNATQFSRSQGNKFACVISKRKTLRSWLEWKDGALVYRGPGAKHGSAQGSVTAAP